MKSNLLPILIILPVAMFTPARAMDWSPDSARILGDPAFLPLRGQVEGAFGYTYSANLYDGGNNERTFSRFDNFATPTHAYDRSTNAFLPYLGYGITDDLSFSAQLGWANERTRDSYIFERIEFGPAAGPITRTTPTPFPFPRPRPQPHIIRVLTQEHLFSRALGADNPDFRLTWRALDQRTEPVDVDIAIGYAPDLFDAREAGFDQTGSVVRGGQRGTIEASVSRELRAFTVRGYGIFGYNGTQGISDVGGFQVTHTGAHPDYTLGLQTETRLASWLAVNVGASVQKSMQYDRSFTSIYGNAVPDTVKPGGSVTSYAELVFPLVNHRIVGELSYAHNFAGTEKVVASTGFNQRYFDQGTNSVAARVLFVFGTR